MTQPIYPCLWFDGQAEEAANFYCSIFKDSRVIENTPLVVHFELNGRRFMGLNGGPRFKFDESISFVITCADQSEIDYYWEKLTDGGEESMCGWLKDRYGLSWQVVPAILGDLMKEKGQKVMDAFLKMQKFDIQALLEV